ncbi:MULTISPECIES: hypothetical protein [unclassified Clostridium]|uniref:hypothetical protein n=1 Tax=unclassified Clostridium TaxID=2614128 RepID=UPI0013F8B0E9|nr:MULTISPECIES: hypothetical protein [unclassified Clostridium]NFR85368.1 hypothetical protein [Clostridium botulinum]NFR90903.1 hypothetical protein [Clostridium botulinum]NFT99533.1 hypothetical protein [Clostridium botulinum]
MVSLKMLKQKSAIVSSLVEDVRNQLPDNDVAENLDNNYDELYSMILDVIETLDGVISDIEK